MQRRHERNRTLARTEQAMKTIAKYRPDIAEGYVQCIEECAQTLIVSRGVSSAPDRKRPQKTP